MMIEPKLRFKADDGSDFPDWEEKTLGELANLFTGKSFTSELSESGRYVVMDMGSVSSDGLIIDSKLTDSNRDLLRKGDLIMPKDDIGGGLIIGKTAYIPCDKKYVCGDHVYRLRFDSGIDALFMHYEINSSRTQKRLRRKVTGSAQLGLNSKSVLYEIVSVPSFPEQRKIADLLSAVDDVIAAQEAEVAAWEKRKKGVMQKLFSQEVRFKADDGSNFPDWEEQKIEDVCVLNPRTEQLDDEFYYMDLGSIDHGRWEAPEIVNKVDAPSRAQRVAAIDDVFFQSVRPYNMGHYHYVAAKDKQVVASTGYIQARMRNGSNAFLYQLFYEERFNAEVNARCTGSNYPAINSRKFGEITVALPSLPEQRKIADCLSALDDVIIKAKNELAKWQELKKGLLQQMFV